MSNLYFLLFFACRKVTAFLSILNYVSNKFSTILAILQRLVVKGHQFGIAVNEISGTQGKEAFVIVMVVTAYCGLSVVYLPVLTVGALPYCGCVAVVQDPYIKVRDAVNRTYVGVLIIEEVESCAAAFTDLEMSGYLILLINGSCSHQSTAVKSGLPSGPHERILIVAQIVVVLQAAVLPLGSVLLNKYGPTVFGPLYALNDGTAAQCMETVAVCMIIRVPWPFDHHCSSAVYVCTSGL